MSATEVLTIGSVIKHRGEYNADTTYYLNNQVTMYNCVFQAIGNDFSGIAPAELNADGTIQLANTTTWKCIIDNVTLYNASLSTHNLDSRTTELEKGVEALNSFAATKGVADGLAPLDENAKIALQYIPNDTIEVLEFKKIVDGVKVADGGEDVECMAVVYDTSARTFYGYTSILTSTVYFKKWKDAGNYQDASDNLPYKGKIYLNTSDNIPYRWTGTELKPLDANINFGTTEGTVFSGEAGAKLQQRVEAFDSSIETLDVKNQDQDHIIEAVGMYNYSSLIRSKFHAYATTFDKVLTALWNKRDEYNILSVGMIVSYPDQDSQLWKCKRFKYGNPANETDWMNEDYWEDFGGPRTVSLTQDEYDALVAAGTVNAETYYNILEDEE